VFVSTPFSIGQVRQFHRLKNSLNNQGRTESGAESKKQHAAAVIAAQSLHRSIVHDADGTPECLFEVMADPASTQVVGLGQRSSLTHRARVADRNGRIFPTSGGVLYLGYHAGRGHRGTRGNLHGLRMMGVDEFEVGSTYVDYEDVLLAFWRLRHLSPFSRAGLYRERPDGSGDRHRRHRR